MATNGDHLRIRQLPSIPLSYLSNLRPESLPLDFRRIAIHPHPGRKRPPRVQIRVSTRITLGILGPDYIFELNWSDRFLNRKGEES